MDGALEPEPAARNRAHAVARGWLRRFARSRSHLRARHEPAGSQPEPAEPPAESAVRGHHIDRIARARRATTRSRFGISSARPTARRAPVATPSASRPTTRRVFLQLRAIRTFRRTVSILAAERGPSSFDIRHRFSAALTSRCPSARTSGWGISESSARSSRIRTSRQSSPFRPDVHSQSHCYPTSRTATPDDRTSDLATTIGRTSAARRRCRAEAPTPGSTPPRSRCRRSARSGTAVGIR